VPKYTVIGIIGASASTSSEADDPDQAIENADLSPTLCHQCAHEVGLGEAYEYIVQDESGETVYDDTDRFYNAAKARVAELEAAINAWADSFWAPVTSPAGSVAAHEASVDALMAAVGREVPKRDGTGT
jgi:hypothetical protein